MHTGYNMLPLMMVFFPQILVDYSLLELVFGLLCSVDELWYFYYIVLHLSGQLQFLEVCLLLATFSIAGLRVIVHRLAYHRVQV